MNEAETCRTLVRPKLEQVGWDDIGQHLYREQLSFTAGRVVAGSGQPKRLKKKFADPDFDGEPAEATQEEIDDEGNTVTRTTEATDDLRRRWADFVQRSAVFELLADRGIDFDDQAASTGHPEADPFDLLCHLAYNAPLRTRRERAERARREKTDFFDRFGPAARAALDAILDKYAEHGAKQLVFPDLLEVPPLSEFGNVAEIARRFGGEDKLLEAVGRVWEYLYAA